jgi:hypothetical protein
MKSVALVLITLVGAFLLFFVCKQKPSGLPLRGGAPTTFKAPPPIIEYI